MENRTFARLLIGSVYYATYKETGHISAEELSACVCRYFLYLPIHLYDAVFMEIRRRTGGKRTLFRCLCTVFRIGRYHTHSYVFASGYSFGIAYYFREFR